MSIWGSAGWAGSPSPAASLRSDVCFDGAEMDNDFFGVELEPICRSLRALVCVGGSSGALVGSFYCRPWACRAMYPAYTVLSCVSLCVWL